MSCGNLKPALPMGGAGFLLFYQVGFCTTQAAKCAGTSAVSAQVGPARHRHREKMVLTGIAIRKLRHRDKPAGDPHSDSLDMYGLAKPAAKYGRFGYRLDSRQNTLALSVYPEVSATFRWWRSGPSGSRKQLILANDRVHSASLSTSGTLRRLVAHWPPSMSE